MPPDLQTKVFCTRDVIAAVACHGLALDVFTVISWLNESQRARIEVTQGYKDVVSFCSRRRAQRQPALQSITMEYARLSRKERHHFRRMISAEPDTTGVSVDMEN